MRRTSALYAFALTLAATAAAHGLSLATFDADFKKIPDVTVELE